MNLPRLVTVQILSRAQKAPGERTEKSAWDKAAIVAQFLSGTVIALIGILISYSFNHGQRLVSERQQFAAYLKAIVEEKDDSTKAALVGALDLAIGPSDAVRLAEMFALSDSPSVKEQAILCLRRLSPAGRETLLKIAKGQAFPDKQLAQAALGLKVKEVIVRMSYIDDDAQLSANGHEIVKVKPPDTPAKDSGWVDITKYLIVGQNKVDFLLHNGPYGGWSGRLQFSAGEWQYDSTILGQNACPCNANVLRISAIVKIAPDGAIASLSVEPPAYF